MNNYVQLQQMRYLYISYVCVEDRYDIDQI